MYRLLVVDDEDFITDSLAYMLESTPLFELDVYKAYSAPEALDYLNKFAFDIVVTDIQMPGMSGVELLKEIHGKWPSCQVIFLTGHDEFEYAYHAVQYHAAKYILKNEGDHVLLSAIGECIALIDRDAHNLELLSRAEEEMRRCKPMLRRSFLQSLLVGCLPSQEEIAREFKRLEVRLDPGLPVMLLAARIEAERENSAAASVDLVVREKTGHAVTSELGWADANTIVWLLQPAGGCGSERAQVTVKGMAESIQRVCAGTLDIRITFVFDAAAVSWDKLADRFSLLRHTVAHRLQKHSDIAIAGLEYFWKGTGAEDREDKPAFILYKDILEKLSAAVALEDAAEVDINVDRLLALLPGCGPGSENGLNTLEFNTELNLILLSYVTRHELQKTFGDDAMFRMFLTGADTEEPRRRLEQFRLLAGRMLKLSLQEQHKASEAFIRHLLHYIRDNLDADLSLCALSEKVYLNPSYLSRRFKELAGKNITDTITELRVAGACRMLEDNKYKISRIASLVGYESAAHFSRIFKRLMGMTPQEYRDKKAYK